MFHYVFYRDVFRRSYQIAAHAGEDIHPGGELMNFYCPVLTQQFLRRIHVPLDFWSQFLSPAEQHGCTVTSRDKNGYHCQVLKCVSQQLIDVQLWIFEFPNLAKKSIYNHKGEAFCFVKGPVPYPADDLLPLALHNDQQINDLLDCLPDMSAEQWHDALNGQELLPDHVNPGNTSVSEYQLIMREQALAGGLLAYQTRAAPSPPKQKEELLPLHASDLPPGSEPEEPKYFIDLEFLYPDLSRIEDDIPYIARFADGSQKTGTLGSSGYVNIADIPPGQVEVEFGDPEAKAQLEDAKKELKSYLDGIISATQSRAKRLDAQLNKLDVLTKGTVLTGAFIAGLYDEVASIAETAIMVAESGIELVGDIHEVQIDIVNNLISGNIDATKQQLEELVTYGEDTLEDMQEAYDTLQLLYTDDDIKNMLMGFPEQYFSVMPTVEQAGAFSSLALSLLLALVTGGAGAAVSAAARAPMFIKAANKIQDITALLKKIKLHRKQSKPHNSKIAEKMDKPKEDKLKEKDKKKCKTCKKEYNASCPNANKTKKDNGNNQRDNTALYNGIKDTSCPTFPVGHKWYIGKNSLEVHHCIDVDAVSDSESGWDKIFDTYEYDINGPHNTVVLPADMTLCCELGVARHKGDHSKGRAFDTNRNKFDELKNQEQELNIKEQEKIEEKFLAYPDAVKDEIKNIKVQAKKGGFCRSNGKPIKSRKKINQQFEDEMRIKSKKILSRIESFDWTISRDGRDYIQSSKLGCSGYTSLATKKRGEVCPDNRQHNHNKPKRSLKLGH